MDLDLRESNYTMQQQQAEEKEKDEAENNVNGREHGRRTSR